MLLDMLTAHQSDIKVTEQVLRASYCAIAEKRNGRAFPIEAGLPLLLSILSKWCLEPTIVGPIGWLFSYLGELSEVRAVVEKQAVTLIALFQKGLRERMACKLLVEGIFWALSFLGISKVIAGQFAKAPDALSLLIRAMQSHPESELLVRGASWLLEYMLREDVAPQLRAAFADIPAGLPTLVQMLRKHIAVQKIVEPICLALASLGGWERNRADFQALPDTKNLFQKVMWEHRSKPGTCMTARDAERVMEEMVCCADCTVM